MVVVRVHAGDYDEWAGLGNPGWSCGDLLPYFKRLETRHERYGAYRGRAGRISGRSGFGDNPLYDAFRQAVLDAGYPETPAYNGASQWGVSQT